MFEHHRVLVFCGLGSALQVVQSSIKLTLSKFHPAEAIQIRGIIRFAFQGASDHQFRLVQVHVVICPHVAQVIACLGRVRRVERNRFTKQIRRFVVQARLFGTRSIIEVKLRV